MLGRRALTVAALALLAGPARAADPPARPFQFGSAAFRHGREVLDAALSADGKLVATVDYRDARVFDVETGRCLYHFPDCGLPIYSSANNTGRVAFSPDGRFLVHVVMSDVAARVWDLGTGKEVGAYGTHPPRAAALFTRTWVQFAPDGKAVQVLRHDVIERHPVPDGKPSSKTKYGFDAFDAYALDPAGRVAAGRAWSKTQAGEGDFAVVDLATGQAIAKIAVQPDQIGFGPGAKTLATLDADKLRVWDSATGKELGSIPRPAAGGQDGDLRTPPAFSPDGSIIYVGGLSGAVRRFDWRAAKELPTLRAHLWWATKVLPLPDGKRILSVGHDGVVRRWDLATGKEIPLPEGYVGHLARATAPAGDRVAVGDWGGRIDVWDARGTAIVRTLQTSGPPVGALAFSPADGSLASLHWDGNVRVWDPAAGRLVRAFRVRHEFTDNPNWFLFSPDGGRLYANTNYSELQAFDPRTGQAAWPQPLTDVYQFAASPDGRTVVFTQFRSPGLQFIDPAAPDRVTPAIPTGPGERGVDCYGLAFIPDGRLASAHEDGSVRVWDVGKRTEVAALRGNTGQMYRVYAAPEGHWLVTWSAGGWAVWDLAAGAAVDTFPDLPPRLRQNGADPGDWPDRSGLLPADWLARIRPAAAAGWPTGEAAWEALGGSDGTAAYRALCGLMADPKAAARLFRAHVSPAVGPPADRVAKLIAQLDAPKFADREAAMRALADLGPLARPAVQDALARGPTAEAADRLRKLLDVPVGKPSPAEVRAARAVQVLEAAGTPEARALLAEWAGGARGPALTEAARRAVERLDRAGRARK